MNFIIKSILGTLVLSEASYASLCLKAIEKADLELSAASRYSSEAYELWELGFNESKKEKPNNNIICQSFSGSIENYLESSYYYERCQTKYISAEKSCSNERNKKLARKRAEICGRNIEASKENASIIEEDFSKYCF